jgi:hypothetical protein
MAFLVMELTRGKQPQVAHEVKCGATPKQSGSWNSQPRLNGLYSRGWSPYLIISSISQYQAILSQMLKKRPCLNLPRHGTSRRIVPRCLFERISCNSLPAFRSRTGPYVQAGYRYGSYHHLFAVPETGRRVIDCFRSLPRGGRAGEYP